MLTLLPNRPFHNFNASRSGVRGIFLHLAQKLHATDFVSQELWKGRLDAQPTLSHKELLRLQIWERAGRVKYLKNWLRLNIFPILISCPHFFYFAWFILNSRWLTVTFTIHKSFLSLIFVSTNLTIGVFWQRRFLYCYENLFRDCGLYRPLANIEHTTGKKSFAC